MSDLKELAPEIVLTFSDPSDVPTTLPEIPILSGGSIPTTGDAFRFSGSESLFVVKGRVFSFDDRGKGTIILNLAKHH